MRASFAGRAADTVVQPVNYLSDPLTLLERAEPQSIARWQLAWNTAPRAAVLVAAWYETFQTWISFSACNPILATQRKQPKNHECKQWIPR